MFSIIHPFNTIPVGYNRHTPVSECITLTPASTGKMWCMDRVVFSLQLTLLLPCLLAFSDINLYLNVLPVKHIKGMVYWPGTRLTLTFAIDLKYKIFWKPCPEIAVYITEKLHQNKKSASVKKLNYGCVQLIMMTLWNAWWKQKNSALIVFCM